jgi:hypothetical protein
MSQLQIDQPRLDLPKFILRFRNAMAVTVMGEFNNWSNISTPLTQVGPDLWEVHAEDRSALGRLRFFVWDHGMLYGRIVPEADVVHVP